MSYSLGHVIVTVLLRGLIMILHVRPKKAAHQSQRGARLPTSEVSQVVVPQDSVVSFVGEAAILTPLSELLQGVIASKL